jgi:peptidoglycan hydrolase-like protein with peptidoglycan-binding domain
LTRSRTLVAVVLLLVTGLLAPPAQAASLGKRALAQGMRGHDVRVLQDFLTRLGVSTTVDGVYGRGTAANVRTWEQASKLRADGRMTLVDIRRMRRQLAVGVRVQRAVAPAPAANRGSKATIAPNGEAIAPAGAPEAVKRIIAAGNRIHDLPYRYGGGHAANFRDSAYDCSGSVSYALRGAGLVDSPMPSGGFTTWGERGAGRWVTVYANGGHMYMVVAGLRFDTSGRAQAGSRWQTDMRSTRGYAVRHPAGL